jgi:peptidoglycan/LPS O-acetylase OafA/YrhL
MTRILPGFFVASVLNVVIGAWSSANAYEFLSSVDVRATLVRVLSLHQAGLRGAFPDNPSSLVDLTLWTIKYEFDCYIIVAMLGLLGSLTRTPVVLVFLLSFLALVAQGAGYLDMPQWDHGVIAIFFSNPQNWPRLFTYFFAGAAFYLWRHLIPKGPMLFVAALAIVVLGLRFGAADIVLVTAGAYCIFYVALSTKAVLRIQQRRVDLSYGLYLFGFPIQQLIVMWSGQSIGPLMLFVTAFPVACAAAYLSWRVVESPSLRWDWGFRPVSAARAGGSPGAVRDAD